MRQLRFSLSSGVVPRLDEMPCPSVGTRLLQQAGATLLKCDGSDAAFRFRQSNDSAPLPQRSDGARHCLLRSRDSLRSVWCPSPLRSAASRSTNHSASRSTSFRSQSEPSDARVLSRFPEGMLGHVWLRWFGCAHIPGRLDSRESQQLRRAFFRHSFLALRAAASCVPRLVISGVFSLLGVFQSSVRVSRSVVPSCRKSVHMPCSPF